MDANDSKGPCILNAISLIFLLLGYDKLQPFGFPIHGAIDGYSRKILWLEVTRSNNDPAITAGFFLECIKEMSGCPLVLRTDNGSENGNMAAMQAYFRRDENDEHSGQKDHRYGSSPSNQRIEAWWSFLKKGKTTWWIDFFKDMVEHGMFDTGNVIHMECLWFCFQEILQEELDKVKVHWNTHRIRNSQYSHVSGVPDVLYFLPERSGGVDCKVPLSTQEISQLESQLTTDNTSHGSDTEIYQEYFSYLLQTNGYSYPKTVEEAYEMFQLFLRIAGHE